MSKSVRLSDKLFEQAQQSAWRFHRSPPQQIEYWAQIGRAMESALSFPAMEKAMAWGGRGDIDALVAEVASDAGQARAGQVIRETSVGLYSAEPTGSDPVIEDEEG